MKVNSTRTGMDQFSRSPDWTKDQGPKAGPDPDPDPGLDWTPLRPGLPLDDLD